MSQMAMVMIFLIHFSILTHADQEDIANITCEDVHPPPNLNITNNTATLEPDAKYVTYAFGIVFASILLGICGLAIFLKVQTEELSKPLRCCVNCWTKILTVCPPQGWDDPKILKYRAIQFVIGIIFLMIALFCYAEVAVTESAARKFSDRPMKLCWKGAMPLGNASADDVLWQATVVVKYYGSGINKDHIITLATCPDLTCHTAPTSRVITLQIWLEWLELNQVYTGRVFATNDFDAHLTTNYDPSSYAAGVCFFVFFAVMWLMACFGNNLYVCYKNRKQTKVSPSSVRLGR